MAAVAEQGRTDRAAERGGILLVVLILCVTCSLLAMALVSTAEVTLRAASNADDLDRAERAACSGVEWAAASVKAEGHLPRTRSVRLGGRVDVTMQVQSVQAPDLVGTGRSNGGEVKVGADVGYLEAGRAYALSSYSATSSLGHAVAVGGAAYFGATPTPLAGSGSLQMAGDLDLVTTTTVSAGRIVHASGVTTYGVSSRTMPAWNTAPFSTDVGWKVPIHRFTGTTQIRDQTLTGLVVVTLGANQTLELRDCTINGCLVVPWLYPPVLDILGTSTIDVRGTVTITGRTAETGNLAILAPGSKLNGNNGVTRFQVGGVCYALDCDGLENTSLTGMLLLRKGFTSTKGAIDVTRPADFLPEVPVGIDFGASSKVVIYWRGRQ